MTPEEEIFHDNEELYNAKSKYLSMRMSSIESNNTVLYYIYTGLVCALIYLLYNNKSIKSSIKYVIVLCAILYPFLIFPIEEVLNDIMVYLGSFIWGESTQKKHSPV